VKTSTGLIKYSGRQDYLKRYGKSAGKAVPAKTIKKSSEPPSKVDLSDQAKEASKKDLAQNPKMKNEQVSSSSNTSSASEMAGVAQKMADLPITPAKELAKLVAPAQEENEESGINLERLKEKAKERREFNRPGIFFVEGLSIGPFSEGGEGLSRMVEYLKDADLQSWDEVDEIVEKISKRPHGQPIILVGQGMGSDSVVEVANQLNTLEHGFRHVDLLVTLDSVGMNNDIIPQNVRKNLNFISDGGWLGDGPNIARNNMLTEVENELRSESHGELDESNEIQFKIFNSIEDVLGHAAISIN
jgi:hypothetical protein